VEKTDSKTVVLDKQDELTQFPYQEQEFWKPEKAHLKIADEMLLQAFTDNKDEFRVTQDTISPDDYYKQLVPYLNQKGERIIYINGLCKSFVKSPIPEERVNELGEISAWKNFFYVIDDGGSCFWQTEINIDKKEYFNFSVNGP